MDNNNSYLDGDFETDFEIDFESNHTIESKQYYQNKSNPVVKFGCQVFNFVLKTITFSYNFNSDTTNTNNNSRESNYDLICKNV